MAKRKIVSTATASSVRMSRGNGNERLCHVRWGSSNSDLEDVAKLKIINTIPYSQPRKIRKVRRIYMLHMVHGKDKSNHSSLNNIELLFQLFRQEFIPRRTTIINERLN